ncbi:MAG TPA: c-type cytochrome [Gemmatimonadaceae bacterium]|jgi:mono/diheme cytochrome c family protein|nr:c-type cytochrome [Gemmatimonadaceae bacterium]
MQNPILRWAGRVLGALAVISLLGATAVYVVSERKLRLTYDTSVPPVVVPRDSTALARGEHLVRNVATCTLCHGSDLGGQVYSSDPMVGTVAGPNLTRGRGGLPADYTVEDYARAIRRGVRRDGRSLMVMPSEVFTYLSQEDLGAAIAYLQQVSPVDREVPPSGFGPVGRALFAMGRLNIMVAGKTPRITPAESVPSDTTAAYGEYLADISGCHGCHGHGLSGGRVAGPPGLPPASNLTPAGIGTWTEADLVRVLREGRRPDGSRIDPFMPWEVYRGMTDAEIRALWLYLRSVPAKPFGNK